MDLFSLLTYFLAVISDNTTAVQEEKKICVFNIVYIAPCVSRFFSSLANEELRQLVV